MGIIHAADSYTKYDFFVGKGKRIGVNTASKWFPLTWTRVCVSFDTVSFTVTIVIDGKVMYEKVRQEDMEKDVNRPINLNITLGYKVDKWGYSEENTGQYSHLNIFSSPLSLKRMVAMTTAGSEECGAPGDFLSWEEADWQILSQARMVSVDEQEEGPCRRESVMHVFTANFNDHSQCMHHCQKLGKGRSPPVRTLQELETLQTEVQAITPNIIDLP